MLRVKKSDLIYLSSNLVLPLSNFLVGVIATSYISPDEMGVYYSALIILVYAKILNLGIFEGLNRNLPIYIAKNENNKLENAINTSYSAAKIISLLGIIFGFSFLVYWVIRGKTNLQFLAAIVVIMNLAIVPLKTHFEAILRGTSNFGILGKLVYKENIFYIIFSLLPILIGYIGKIISESFTLVFSFFLRKRFNTFKSSGYGTIDDLVKMIKIGFPILISGYLWEVFTIIDQTFISIKLSTRDLGFYTLSRLVMTAFILIPNSINALFYPKLCEVYGISENSSTLRPYWKKVLSVNAIIILPLVGLASILLPFLTNLFLPNYKFGINAARINIITAVSLVFISPSFIFGIIGKNMYYILGVCFFIIVYSGILFLFPGFFLTIEAVAYLKLFVFLSFSVFIFLSTYKYTNKHIK